VILPSIFQLYDFTFRFKNNALSYPCAVMCG
jgi:hypothetical protein